MKIWNRDGAHVTSALAYSESGVEGSGDQINSFALAQTLQSEEQDIQWLLLSDKVMYWHMESDGRVLE